MADLDALQTRHATLCSQYDALISGSRRQKVSTEGDSVDFTPGDPAALLRQIGLVERQIKQAGGSVADPRTSQGGPKSVAVWGR